MTEPRLSAGSGVQEFLGRFKEFSDAHASQRVNGFTQWFGGAVGALSGFRQLDAAWQRAAAPHFNVFRVLGMERREVRTHSAFLAELLNPSGSHGQGAIFLRDFIEQVLGLPPGLADQGDWEAGTELTDAWLDGRLDIMLRSNKAKVVIAIENKIDALDQEKQIPRYRSWLDNSFRHKGFPESQRVLVYLTIDGHKPAEGKADKCMSYKTDVRGWLRTASAKVEAPRLSDALRQYVDIIEQL